MLKELPAVALDFAHSEKVKKDYVIKFKSFRLVDSKAEHAFHEFRQLLLHSLLTDDDYLTSAEVRSYYSSIRRILGDLSLDTIFVVFNHLEFFLNDYSLTHCLAKEELAEKVIPDSVN